MNVFPVIFEPIYKPKIWGGRRLEEVLAKKLPPDQPIGESWEIADLEDDQTRVAGGPAKGKTLHDLMAEWGTDLLGRATPFEGRFPLLIKFLDAREILSVQVHPSPEVARQKGGRIRIKNEAWYVIATEEGGFIYHGLKEGVDEAALRAAITDNRIEDVLRRVPVRRGHCYYLPSGTIHALGAGVLVAEVQTPSDITYRVYDFDRIEPATGQRRELHVDEAMACIDFGGGTPPEQRGEHVASVWTSVSSLVRSESFVIERVRMVAGVEQPVPHAEMVIWMVLEGNGELRCKGLRDPLAFGLGDTVLIPAGIEEGFVSVDENTMWLEITLPIPSDLTGFERPSREALQAPAGGGLVQLGVPERQRDEDA